MSADLPRIAVLATGTELLSGELSDSNSAVIARQLARVGLQLAEVRVVGDSEADISAALQQLAEGNRVVICTGGLGPTSDDLTARAAARACEKKLVLNDEALQLIKNHFRRINRPLQPGNEKQALLPHKCRLLENRRGTAPGFHLRRNETDLYFLPGVPDEMATMCQELVIPDVQRFIPERLARLEKIVKVFGLAEPQVETLLHQAALPGEVEVAYGVEMPVVLVKLRSAGEHAERLDRAELLVRKALGDFAFGGADATLSGVVCQLLADHGTTLSLAESCTGGMIAKLLTDTPGSSAFLERGAVTYANSAKHDWLQVPAEVLARQGAVSRQCAVAMAEGIRRTARTDLGLAVTGIAGPSGGTADKPVGTVFIALAGTATTRVEEFRFGGNRERIRTLTSYTALDWLRRYAMQRFEEPEHA
ncbi:MAG TPA: competence/damage-inducible protein A [Geothermobacteraceae bacterium]|nr:competence/damage-inducible protein A [Geothermobacteraceae bacterium]